MVEDCRVMVTEPKGSHSTSLRAGWEGKVWRTHSESQAERIFHVCEPHE